MTAALAEVDGLQFWWRPQPLAGFVNSVTDLVSVVRPTISPPSTVSFPQWVNPTLERMIQLGDLGQNWDGRGSAAVRNDTLVFALSMLSQAMAPTTAPPSIVPLGHGGVQLSWINSSVELEVEVVRPNEIVIYHLDRSTGAEREWQAVTEFSELADLLRSEFTS